MSVRLVSKSKKQVSVAISRLPSSKDVSANSSLSWESKVSAPVWGKAAMEESCRSLDFLYPKLQDYTVEGG